MQMGTAGLVWMRACPLVSTALHDTCLLVRMTHYMRNSITFINCGIEDRCFWTSIDGYQACTACFNSYGKGLTDTCTTMQCLCQLSHINDNVNQTLCQPGLGVCGCAHDHDLYGIL